MSDMEFADGMMAKPPFVVCKLSLKKEDFMSWLSAREGDWVNLEVAVSKEGKYYVRVDNWKPEKKQEPANETPLLVVDDDDDGIPF